MAQSPSLLAAAWQAFPDSDLAAHLMAEGRSLFSPFTPVSPQFFVVPWKLSPKALRRSEIKGGRILLKPPHVP